MKISEEKRERLFWEMIDKAKKMRELAKEIYYCERIIDNYNFAYEFEREFPKGAIIILPYEIEKEYREVQYKLPKLKAEYFAVAEERQEIEKYLDVTEPKGKDCDHIGQCTLCALWSTNGCKLFREYGGI